MQVKCTKSLYCQYQQLLFPAVILNFTQSADVTGPNGNITFNCVVAGSEAHFAVWKINDASLQGEVDDMVVSNTRGYDKTDSSLYVLRITIQALSYNNETKISCHVPNQRPDRFFIIAGIWCSFIVQN